MSDQIEAGDLVYMVGDPLDLLCEHAQRYLGLPFKVEGIFDAPWLICPYCFRHWKNVRLAKIDEAVSIGDANFLRMSWLKKIPPAAPEETEQYGERKKVTA